MKLITAKFTYKLAHNNKGSEGFLVLPNTNTLTINAVDSNKADTLCGCAALVESMKIVGFDVFAKGTQWQGVHFSGNDLLNEKFNTNITERFDLVAFASSLGFHTEYEYQEASQSHAITFTYQQLLEPKETTA